MCKDPRLLRPQYKATNALRKVLRKHLVGEHVINAVKCWTAEPILQPSFNLRPAIYFNVQDVIAKQDKLGGTTYSVAMSVSRGVRSEPCPF